MTKVFTKEELEQQHTALHVTGALSDENREHGFLPVFLDTERGEVHPSCYANGQPATIHILDGLPKHLVLSDDASAVVKKVKASVIAGFLRDNIFYTREEAAAAFQCELRDNRALPAG